MEPSPREFNITRNIRVIEWLKAELVEAVAALFKGMLKGSEEAIVDGLASILITAYILGRRVGISFSRLDLMIQTKLKLSIHEAHEVEKWYGDLSALYEYLVNNKKR
ncbi:MAG: hypothetical protein HPY81_04745 [Firmicutes bacterium]|nr:hypothetical protein [Bacillota bacterium]